MAKVLTDRELLEIVRRTIEDGELDSTDQYLEFLTDLGEVIAKHFGGTVGTARDDSDLGDEEHPMGYAVSFNHDAKVPEDGGIYAGFDTGVSWVRGREEQQ